MRDRVRIMLGSREIVKRYIGDRLVWSSGPSLLLEVLNTRMWQYWGGYNIDIKGNDIKVAAIRYVQLNNSKLIRIQADMYNRGVIYLTGTNLREYIGTVNVKFYRE
ncbi:MULTISPECIES: hypothetical protein [Streptococcus]|uniref:hypothetical protein n=3 Tax=Streptococcus TaxID=1301 RepID=UPI0003D2ECEC|nr:MULTISPECIES: hypothetical protein [Streptococcus]ETD93357.1 hypothetical protein U752_06205 [Streptococcus pseudopneumoniae 1321]MBF9655839.1 hypothetical protein [Streptococcus pseudopneumoniae]MBF9687034.1 hypothetical protein [Streptococcus pseudopneumoniae]CJY64126.1 Uncharacterised protein [Streptococcus pseudopneumoniae]COC60451.1 Uncharacterised protein [Streptococcus pseudopneumoniae]